MANNFDVVSIGAATVDIFVKSTDFAIMDHHLLLPCSTKVEMNDSLITSGGGATNSSVGFSRLGLKSACLSRIGLDYLSQLISHDLEKDNVHSLLSRRQRDTTDYSVIVVAPDGGRTILTTRGDTCLRDYEIDYQQLKGAKWLYITSLEGNLDLLEKIIGFSLENDIRVSLNPGNRELSKLKLLKPLLKHLDFLLLNREEALKLTQKEDVDDGFWSTLRRMGSSITAVTDGRNGAYVLSGDGTYFSPIINTKPIDETGAGDSFGTAFVASLMHGHTPDEALYWGVKNSASVVSYLGAKNGLLHLKQIL